MNSLFTPQIISKRYRALRIAVIAGLVFSFQVVAKPPHAKAGGVTDAYISISTGIAFDLGYRACSYLCAAAAVGAMTTVNTYAPSVTKKSAVKAKAGFVEMITQWGSTYVRP